MYYFDEIREFYKIQTNNILDAYNKHPQKWTAAHSGMFEWLSMFSPNAHLR